MKAVGVIAEYNPFHNGHAYHLQKIKEQFQDATIILILSGCFTQRGGVSILDKWTKTKIALEAGIDLVVELPFPFATASADIFAEGAMKLLNELHVDAVVFGSESNDIEGIKKLVDTQLNNPTFDTLTKVHLRMGYNYPTSLSMALTEITGHTYHLPNDILGISYVKAIAKNNYKIKPFTIKRTTDYHNKDIDSPVVSAKAIRCALANKENIDEQVPEYVRKYIPTNMITLDAYFSFLRYKILTEEDLEKYMLVDPGLNDKLKKVIIECKSVDDMIQKLKSKNLTYNRLSRMLLYILCSYTKEKAKSFKEVSYIRLLGFSTKGKEYLHEIKKGTHLPIVSKFKKGKDLMLTFEYQITKVYALGYSQSDMEKLVSVETSNCPIRKEEMYGINGKN